MRPTSVIAASAASVASLVLGPISVAHAQETPLETIARLQQAGYTVNIDRVGSGPLESCVVTGVRNPQTVTDYVQVYDGKDDEGNAEFDSVPVIVSRSISVSLNCA